MTHQVLAVLAGTVLDDVLPDATPAQRAAGTAHVTASVAAMPDSTRWGVRAVGSVVYAVASVIGGRGLEHQQAADRSRRVARVLALPLPGVAEYGRLVRGLGLVGALETPGRPR